jgi:hypothetical protein
MTPLRWVRLYVVGLVGIVVLVLFVVATLPIFVVEPDRWQAMMDRLDGWLKRLPGGEVFK